MAQKNLLYKNTITYTPTSIQDLRNWFIANHQIETAVWFIFYKKTSNISSVTWSDAVSQAICFGWIDSVANKKDENSWYQYFSKRKPKSNWSAVNKNKVMELAAAKQIYPAGQAMIDLAKQTGTWDALNEVDALLEPPDLLDAFAPHATALLFWQALNKSSRRGVLENLLNAKKPETKSARIAKIVALCLEEKNPFSGK
jgi:uncharacterized protein YdeI (YjbR/CyaY-like superfamily)